MTNPAVLGASETLNSQFGDLDISSQNASTIFEAFNQLFFNSSSELEASNLQQISNNANSKYSALFTLLNDDPASVLALLNSTINNTNGEFSSVPLLNTNLGIFDAIEQTGIDSLNTTDLLNIYNSILQLTGNSAENEINDSKISNDQAIFAEALNQIINLRDTCSTSEQQNQQQQQLLSFNPSILLTSEFASLLSSMTAQNFGNIEEIEKNFCKQNLSTFKR